MKDWRKYLIEVFVIMFSILGAFWLEEWNEDRIEEKDTLTLLESLKENLLDDRRGLKGLESGGINRIQSLNDDLEKLESVDITDSLRIKNLVTIIFWILEQSAHETTFQEMINTGKFYKIKKPEIKNDISSYYKKFRINSLNIEEYNNEAWNLRFNPLSMDRLILKYDVDRKNLNNSNSKWLNDPTDERFKWFKFQILTHIDLAKYQLSSTEELLEVNNEVVKSIESYLLKN